MRSLANLSSVSSQFLVAFFLQLLRLIVLTIYVSWKHFKQINSSYKYKLMINKKCSNFCCKSVEKLDDCSICLSSFDEGDEVKELVDCGHVFHRGCLERWLWCYRATCPLCRSVVVPEEVVREYHRSRMDQENDRVEKELALILLKVLHGGNCRHGFF